MSNDRQRDLVSSLSELCPGLAVFYESHRGLFAREDGTLSVHGVFSVLTDFVLAQGEDLPDVQLGALLAYCEQYLHVGKLGNAIQTCFLENLEGAPNYPRIRGLLGRDSRRYLDTTPFA